METWESWEDALDEKPHENLLEYHDDPETILLLLLTHATHSDDFHFFLDKRPLRQVNRLMYSAVNDSLTSLGPWEGPSDNGPSSNPWPFFTIHKSKLKGKKAPMSAPTHLPLSLIAKCPRLTKLSMIGMENFSFLEGVSDLSDRLEVLWLYRTNVVDLSPLQGCTRLENLDLSGTDILFLSGLEGCISLRDLDCSGSKVFDISALSSCHSLTSLNISATFVTDLTPLCSLPSLNTLVVADCEELTDLTPISKLTTITLLVLSDCQEARGLKHLSALVLLKELILNGFEIEEDDALPHFPSLTFLDASYSNVSSLSHLSACMALERLELRSCHEIIDLEPLSYCTGLLELDLSSSSVNDISDLGVCTLLTSLSLPGSVVTGLSILPKLKNLASLCISGSESNEMVDLSLLSSARSLTQLDCSSSIYLTSLFFSSDGPWAVPLSFTSLQSLTCSYNAKLVKLWSLSSPPIIALTRLEMSRCSSIRDTSPLVLCVTLETLDCSGCTGITELPSLPLLTSLNCSQTGMRTLLPLPAITWLTINDTQISSIKFLEGCIDLNSLEMENTFVSDVSPLSSCTALETLSCSNTKVKDLFPLASCAALTFINVSNTEISSIKCLENLPCLNHMELEYNKLPKEVIKSWADGRKGRFGLK